MLKCTCKGQMETTSSKAFQTGEPRTNKERQKNTFLTLLQGVVNNI